MIAEAVTSGLVAALLTTYPPVGCVVDCSTWHGKVTTQNHIWLQTLDGKVIRDLFEYPADTDPSSPRIGFRLLLNHFRWEYEMVGEYRFFVRGSKAAPLRRVIIKPVKPGDWTPTYYFVWTYPPHTAPLPRPVNR